MENNNNNNEIKKTRLKPAVGDDFFVRYFFGSKGNEDLLLSFINAIMIDSNFATFKSVEILNPFNLKDKSENKESIVDLKAITEDGIIVIIEIQTYSTKNFSERTLYYWSKKLFKCFEKRQRIRRAKTCHKYQFSQRFFI